MPDSDLFKQLVKGVKPLDQDKVQPDKPRPAARVCRHADIQGDSEELEAPFENLNIETGSLLSYARPGLQKAVLRKLRQGKYPIHAELDLHGLFVQQAEDEIRQFISYSSVRGLRCVRVIHGKGRTSSSEPGILKQRTNNWLRQISAVTAFCSCKPEDGGTGAVYVLLAQKR